jgi:ATP-binding cassette subfamily B protein
MALSNYASKGAISFLWRYVRRRFISHGIVLVSVLSAVTCAIASQYAVKHLVDVLGTHEPTSQVLWGAVGLLLALVAGDNLLWRLAGWASTYAFVAVGGDMRLELFDHLSGQGTRYFIEQFPGALAGRITVAANSAWTIENALTWTTIPPGAAVIGSILVLSTINWWLTIALLVVVIGLSVFIGYLASQGRALHQSFAGHAAHVSGDLTDVVSNIGLVRAFGAAGREQQRLGTAIANEMQAQRASLRSLERLRLFHALTVFGVTAGVLVWSVELWRRHEISVGDVVLTTTLGFTVLHASRDFAMAMVDMVQQFAKLGEAVQVLGLPHEMQDAPDAKPLVITRGAINFRNVSFSYPREQNVLNQFDLEVPGGQKIGSGCRGGADRWSEHRSGDAGKLAQLDRRRAAGYIAVAPFAAREPALRVPGGERRAGISRG